MGHDLWQPLKQPSFIFVAPTLCVGPTAMTLGCSAGCQISCHVTLSYHVIVILLRVVTIYWKYSHSQIYQILVYQDWRCICNKMLNPLSIIYHIWGFSSVPYSSKWVFIKFWKFHDTIRWIGAAQAKICWRYFWGVNILQTHLRPCQYVYNEI